MKISKYRLGAAIQRGTFVPSIERPFLQIPVQSDRHTIVFIKPFSKRHNVTRAHLSDNPKGLVCILSERLTEWTDDCIGVRIDWNRDRLVGGRVVRKGEDIGPHTYLLCGRIDENFLDVNHVPATI